jgi:hypothetical protein
MEQKITEIEEVFVDTPLIVSETALPLLTPSSLV